MCSCQRSDAVFVDSLIDICITRRHTEPSYRHVSRSLGYQEEAEER